MSNNANTGFARRSKQVDSIRATRKWNIALQAAQQMDENVQRSLCVKLLADQAKAHRNRAHWCRGHGRERHQDATRIRMLVQLDEALTCLERAQSLMQAAMLNAKDMQAQRGVT